MSLPTWERGLKLLAYFREINDALSLPTWERGLKQRFSDLTKT